MDEKMTHLEMIQGVINRMGHNSFLLKGWSVVLVSALFALAAGDAEMMFVYLAYLPATTLWGLDGYYLRQERLFRRLYDRARKVAAAETDFSMDTSVVKDQVKSWGNTTFSATVFLFHGTVIATITTVAIVATFLL